MKVETNEKLTPLQLVDKRIMKTRELNKNRKMEIMSLFPLLVHLLYSQLHQLQTSATLIRFSQPRLSKLRACSHRSDVCAMVYCISLGKMHAVCSVKLHVDRMFEHRTE